MLAQNQNGVANISYLYFSEICVALGWLNHVIEDDERGLGSRRQRKLQGGVSLASTYREKHLEMLVSHRKWSSIQINTHKINHILFLCRK